MKKITEKIILAVSYAIIIITALVFITPAFITDRFIVKGDSMFPTYGYGEKVWVNKLIMGARIYTDYDFDSPSLGAFRMPGIRNIKAGDVAVFNCPYGRERDKIEFKINYVYVKRCLGGPGDTISIQDCRYVTSGYDGEFGSMSMRYQLQHTPDSLIPYTTQVYPFDENMCWTMREMGPFYIPEKGARIRMDSVNVNLYGRAIEYETGHMPRWTDGKCMLGDDNVLDAYTFKEDYCYFVGDNVLNSRDSRYFGLVPELYVIGIVR